MRRFVAGVALFAAGVGVGVYFMQPSAAQQTPSAGLRLNHVGIYVADFEKSLRYYTQTLGFREAFTIRGADGEPTLAYLHVTRDTFLELAPASTERPVGVSHIAFWPENLDAALTTLRGRGIEIADPRTGSTGTRITNMTDPDGVRLELVDFTPGSAPQKAIDSYRP